MKTPYDMPQSTFIPPTTAPPLSKGLRFQDEKEIKVNRYSNEDMNRVLSEVQKVHKKVDSLTLLKYGLLTEINFKFDFYFF